MEGGGSQNLHSPPFSPKSSDFSKMLNPAQFCVLPRAAGANAIVQPVLEIPLFSDPSEQAGESGIPQVEGAAIFPIGVSRGCLRRRVCTGREKEKKAKRREEGRNPDTSLGEKVTIASVSNEKSKCS